MLAVSEKAFLKTELKSQFLETKTKPTKTDFFNFNILPTVRVDLKWSFLPIKVFFVSQFLVSHQLLPQKC